MVCCLLSGTYVFDGELSATLISALSALITPNLYTEKATISELTVDQLDTGTKVQNYLNADTGDVNYIKIVGQTIQFITASPVGTYGASVTDSGQWDMASNDQNDVYYSGVSVDPATGEVHFFDPSTPMDAYAAF